MRVALFDLALAEKERLRPLLQSSDALVEVPDIPNTPVEADVLIASRFAPKDAGRVRFRMLQTPGAGVDKIALQAIPDSVWICNAYEHEGPIAEYVFAAMLDATVGLTSLARQIPEKGWAGAYFSRQARGELAGKTVGVYGLGHIGEAIARRAKAFDMRVMAIAARPRASAENVDWIATPDKLDALLAESDFLVLAAPLNDATRGVIDKRALSRMKPNATLINVARAEIVAEADLYEALKERRIAGAVLDPWYAYPASAEDRAAAPSRFPFASLDNVRMTPHAAAWTDELWDRRCAFFAKNIARLAAGEPLLNVVRAPASA